MSTFVSNIGYGCIPSPEESVKDSIFHEYERVVISSLITSFGLDFLVRDQHGGDVDTIFTVREIGVDPEMTYKNPKHATAYEQRGDYSEGSYHGDGTNYARTKHIAKKKWENTGQDIKDAYTEEENIGFHGKTKAIPPERKAELDHIVECKQIHDDRGRVLAGLKGEDLADANENLTWTNKSLNASMGSWARQENERYRKEHGCNAPESMLNAEAYINAHPDLDETTKRNLRKEYKKAKDAYEAKIATKYYTSADFWGSTMKASAWTGARMGVKQALGLVFTEIWFSVKEAIEQNNSDDKSLFESIGNAVKEGLERAKTKWQDIWHKFIEGAIAGVLSSLTTTLCNIFFKTAKNIVRVIRQSWASLVESGKILFVNPDCYPLGDRILAAAKVLSTGASVVAGVMVGELISSTPIGKIGVLGDIVQTFVSTMVSGILSVSFLHILDHCTAIKKIVDVLNKVPTIDNIYIELKEKAKLLEEYCAKLQEIDLVHFQKEVQHFMILVSDMAHINNENVLHNIILEYIKSNNICVPWEGSPDIDTHLANPNNTLVFK